MHSPDNCIVPNYAYIFSALGWFDFHLGRSMRLGDVEIHPDVYTFP